MNTKQSIKGSFAMGIAMMALCLIASSPLYAAGRKKNPTSKLFVADVEGFAEIDTGETIAELNKRSVYIAQGTIIETKQDSTNSLVFSNGTGIHFDPDTRLEVDRFVQEPFTPNRTDMDVEPSISTTRNYLPRGSIGLCTSKMVAGSTMRYTTPNASIRINARKAVIQSDNEGTTVAVLEGEVTVQAGENDAGGYLVKPGQQAFVPRAGGPVQISPITKEQMPAFDDKVAMACMARKTVYFEAKSVETAFQSESGQEIVVVETTEPPAPPPEFTISAANL